MTEATNVQLSSHRHVLDMYKPSYDHNNLSGLVIFGPHEHTPCKPPDLPDFPLSMGPHTHNADK